MSTTVMSVLGIFIVFVVGWAAGVIAVVTLAALWAGPPAQGPGGPGPRRPSPA